MNTTIVITLILYTFLIISLLCEVFDVQHLSKNYVSQEVQEKSFLWKVFTVIINPIFWAILWLLHLIHIYL